MSTEHSFIKLVDGWGETRHGPNMSFIDTTSRFALEKIARQVGIRPAHVPPKLAAKIAELQGKLPKDKVAFYNRALGTFESYGLNNNGDGWFRPELMRKHATFVDVAKYFKWHNNKLERGDPFFGAPVCSEFNDRTDMVDLIIVADLDKQAEEDIQLLERGISVPTSMGCRVKFDVCTICGKQSKHPDFYCEHVHKTASLPYGMCEILPDGRVCGVMNPDPIFFDISRVRNPAFKGSENLLKVASNGEKPKPIGSGDRAITVGMVKSEKPVSTQTKKASTAQKLADMIKKIPGRISSAIVPSEAQIAEMQPACAGICSKEIPQQKLKDLAKTAGIDVVLTSALSAGLILSPREFSSLIDKNVDVPSAESILTTEPIKVAQDLLNAKVDHNLAVDLLRLSGGRSFLQPNLFNAIESTKTAEVTQKSDRPAACDKLASALYVSYRSAVLSRLAEENPEFETSVMKVAETGGKIVTNSSAAFALLAFSDAAMGKQNMSESQNLAKVGQMANNRHAPMRVSGGMADDFGEDVLETMTSNSLQSFKRS